jgi:MFS family permease
MQADWTVVISVDKEFAGYKKQNFYMTTFLLGFLWMLFHFTVIFFFTFQLKSVMLVGIFLGIWNLVSFLIDIPVGILQKYFKPKTLFIIGTVFQLIAMSIFTLFIFQATDFITTVAKTDSKILDTIIGFLFWNILNIILLLLASMCYGIAKEVNDVTLLSYIMNNVPPTRYSEIMARSGIFSGIGMLLWLISAWSIMSLNPKFIIFTLIFFIILVVYFMTKFFDNATESLHLSDVKNLKVSFQKTSIEDIKEYVTETISTNQLKDIISKTKYIFLKPKELKHTINIWEIIKETKSTFIATFKILAQKPLNIALYWTIITVLTMGFWDTFASTFLIDFLDSKAKGFSYLLLALIAIPAFWLQEFFWKLGSKLWVFFVALIGIGLSGGSLLFMGIFSGANVMFVIGFALMNSVWYAAAMSLGQMSFLDNYNKEYARYMNLTEIDSNASAGPMKILQNLANVVWLMLGWFILGILGYMGFFILFWLMNLAILFWSLKHKRSIIL